MDTNAPKLPWTRTETYARVTVGSLQVTLNFWAREIHLTWSTDQEETTFLKGTMSWPEGIEDENSDVALVAMEVHLRKLLTWQETSAAAGLAALNGHGPWTLGAKVTVFSNPGCERPVAVATIGRMAKHGFRLQGTGEWYDFEGKRVAEDKTMRFCSSCMGRRRGMESTPLPTGPVVRPWREGDEARILAEEARILAKKDKEQEKRNLVLRRERLVQIITGDTSVRYANEESARLQRNLRVHEETLAAHKEASAAAVAELVGVEAQAQETLGIMTQDLLLQYVKLLRRAWLNPSYAPWQEDVCAFEREHAKILEPYWQQWQNKK